MSSPNEPTPRPLRSPSHARGSVVPVIPIVLPLVGGALMFLLAFIAIYMA
jgi:hypothetical protein